MGLLGDTSTGDPLTDLGMIGGLLTARVGSNWPQLLMQAATQHQIQQKTERENRRNELTDLLGMYKIAQDNDQQARQEATFYGKPYTPDPQMLALQQRINEHIAQSPMTRATTTVPGLNAAPMTPQPQNIPPVQQPQMGPQSAGLSPAIASRYSPVVRPEFQAQGPMPQPAPQQPQQPTGQPNPQTPIGLFQIARNVGIPDAVSLGYLQQRDIKGLQTEILKMTEPKNGPAGVTRLNPMTGQLEIMGGSGQPGQVPYLRGADGTLTAQPIKGAAEEVARAEALKTGAVEAAKAPYSFGTYPTGVNAAPQIMSTQRLMQLEAARGGQPPQSAPQFAPQQPGQPGQPAQLSVTQPPRPGSGTSFGGGLSGPDPVRVSADKTQADSYAKFYADTFTNTQSAGLTASSGLQKLDRIQQLMQGINTGKLTPAGMEVAGYAQSLGIPLDPKLGNKQAAEALAGQIALELRNPSGGAGMPGALSDNDLKFLRSMTPGLAQTPEGRNSIIETKRKLLERDKDVATLARQYKRSHNGIIDDGFSQALQDYSTSHPLFPQQAAPPAASGGWSIQEVK